MSLTGNRRLQRRVAPHREEVEIVNGAIEIFQGAILNFEAGNIGFAKLGSDTASEEFAGIVDDQGYLLQTAAVTADGTNKVKVILPGSGELVRLPFTSSISRANIGDTVYVVDDEEVGLAGDVSNSVRVGTLRAVDDATWGWVQLD